MDKHIDAVAERWAEIQHETWEHFGKLAEGRDRSDAIVWLNSITANYLSCLKLVAADDADMAECCVAYMKCLRGGFGNLPSLVEGMAPEKRAEIDAVVENIYQMGVMVGGTMRDALRLPFTLQAEASIDAQASATAAAKKANTKADTPALLAAAKSACAMDSDLSLSRCARRLGEEFDRDPRNVREGIKHLFELRQLPSGRREYRPKRSG